MSWVGAWNFLPPVGAEVPFTMHAAAVPLKLDSLGSLTIGFKGGIDILVRGAGDAGIALSVERFRMKAGTSPSTPAGGRLISLTHRTGGQAPPSVVQTGGGSGRLVMLIHLDLAIEVVDKATRRTVRALAMDPTRHATLKATDVKSFPPVDQPAGTLDGFDVVVNQSAAA
jgi:hypothetical protein